MPPPALQNPGGSGSGATVFWTDATSQVGLDFQHDNGSTGDLLLPEIMGSGAALLDVDGDGDLDLFLVQGGPLAGTDPATTRPPHRLFRNDLDAASGTLKFTDVTGTSGIRSAGYGMGVASGDFDNDGLVDLYVCSLGPNQLLKNLGGGRFADITSRASVEDTAWSSSATFFDYDKDGHLDLFVTNYVAFDRSQSPACFSPNSARDYCGPDAYPAVHDSLFHNLGNGSFENVSEAAGLLTSLGAGLGVVAADFNNDGWCDIYVANDGDPNQLWINQQGSGRFEEEGLLAGVALNLQGQAEAGMGVDAADLDNDGDEDLFITNLTGESNTLYVNLGDGLFEDRTIALGMSAPSLPFTSFGTRFIDYDLDGDLDLFAMNGAVRMQHSLMSASDPHPLRQTNQLFRNDGAEGFHDGSDAEPALAFSGVSRGACIGDVDNDGDLDLLISTNGGPARLLLNGASAQQSWIGFRLVDSASGSDLLQSRVTMTVNEIHLSRRVHTDGSYQSAGDSRILVGLGKNQSRQAVAATWPDGLVETWDDLAAGRYHTLRRGTGRPAEAGKKSR